MRRSVLPLGGPVLALLALGALVATGCSSDSSGAESSTTTSVAPEDILVPNAQVTTGLAALGGLVRTASGQAAASPEAAKATVDQAWNQWLAIEGRIKKNDTGAYLEFEDALSDMRIGADEQDAAKVKKGATAVAALSASYLGQYPG